MPVWIGLLRGVNVVGRRTVKMDALRGLCGELGFENACTYLASGNVVFRCTERSPAKVAQRLRAGMEERFGFAADVVLRSAAELDATLAANPFSPRDDVTPSRLLILFLENEPTSAVIAKVRALPCHPDEVLPHGREIFIHYPNGQGRATLSFSTLDRALGMVATGRNLNTARGLLALARQMKLN